MSYGFDWIPAAAVLGLVTLLFVPYLGLLMAIGIPLLAVAAVVWLAAALIVEPFRIVHSVRRRHPARTPAARSTPSMPRPVPGSTTAGPFAANASRLTVFEPGAEVSEYSREWPAH